MRGAHTRVLIAADAHSRPVCVLRLVSTADNKTERLRVLLSASIMAICIARMFIVAIRRLPKEINAALE